MDRGNLITLPTKKGRIGNFVMGCDAAEFVNKVKDQVRNRQKRMSNVAESCDEHSIIWGMFMAATLNAATFMGKNFSTIQSVAKNHEYLTLKQMFDVTAQLVNDQTDHVVTGMGKPQECKEYHTANQLANKCSKGEYESIHDRFIRDRAFRRAMINHGRTEQMIIEMDKFAKEDHSYKANKEEIEFYRGNWWLHSNLAHVDSVPTRYEPEFKKCVVNNAAPEASRGSKEARSIGTNLFILVFLALACKLVGV